MTSTATQPHTCTVTCDPDNCEVEHYAAFCIPEDGVTP